MKRNDIKLDVWYAYTMTKNGISCRWAKKIKVIDLGRFDTTARYNRQIMRAKSGHGVLVEMPNGSKFVANIRGIVSTWEEYEAHQQVLDKKSDEHYVYEMQKRTHLEQVHLPLCRELMKETQKALGGSMVTPYNRMSDWDTKTVQFLLELVKDYHVEKR